MKTALLLLLTSTPLLFGQETALTLDPAQTHIDYVVPTVLHTVHGTFKLKRAAIRYDFATGKCSGEIVIDAQSGNSDSEARDRRMNKSVLESDKYPEIVFTPDHVEGSLAKANVHGMFRIHGKDHEMTLTVTAVPAASGFEMTTQFSVPYVQWGMMDPSTFVLRVNKIVTIDVHATARIP